MFNSEAGIEYKMLWTMAQLGKMYCCRLAMGMAPICVSSDSFTITSSRELIAYITSESYVHHGLLSAFDKT